MRAAAVLLLTCLLARPLAAADTTLGTGVTLDTATPIADVIATPAGRSAWRAWSPPSASTWAAG
jgi:hypothetical protein